MATSPTSICNLALQKLGSDRIVSIDDTTSKGAKECSACYEQMRDRELRANRWKFSLKRVVLAPHVTAPTFTYLYAFALPSDCLRPLFPARTGLDWKTENHEGVAAILTNDGTSINLRYIAKITDTNLFDPLFVDALACKIAWNVCERMTQSNSKKDAIFTEYKMAIADARKVNALEVGVQTQPVDEWLLSRRTGQLVNSEWGEE